MQIRNNINSVLIFEKAEYQGLPNLAKSRQKFPQVSLSSSNPPCLQPSWVLILGSQPPLTPEPLGVPLSPKKGASSSSLSSSHYHLTTRIFISFIK